MGLKYPAVPWVAPFVAFIAMLVLDRQFIGPGLGAPLRILVSAAAIVVFSRSVLDLRAKNPVSSAVLGVAVFVIWVGPDVLWPEYRNHWLFQNPVTGRLAPAAIETAENWWFIVSRGLGAALAVPILEELFWRGWLARWLIRPDFQSVPLGAYGTASFWIGSALFASEHGSYWEVGLITGCLYNWWMIRTKNLANCIVAHATTNACLAAYVVKAGKWQYWL